MISKSPTHLLIQLIVRYSFISLFFASSITGNVSLGNDNASHYDMTNNNPLISKEEVKKLNSLIDFAMEMISEDTAHRYEKVTFVTNWSSPSEITMANRYENEASVWLKAGIYLHPIMNFDSVALVLCHEIGHLYGGEPASDNPLGQSLSIEAQADYFATKECMNKVVEHFPMDIENEEFDEEVLSYCGDLTFGTVNYKQCLRVVSASKRFATYMAIKENLENMPSIFGVAILATETNYDYPSPQCRLNTFIASYNKEKRPSCWFVD
ncbi:MAG: hypothetical protein ISR65_18345 [Bacteriovoracaceae bacterium]|nr:hypothetical protein [Bacteriovoracaceae bacterium]